QTVRFLRPRNSSKVLSPVTCALRTFSARTTWPTSTAGGTRSALSVPKANQVRGGSSGLHADRRTRGLPMPFWYYFSVPNLPPEVAHQSNLVEIRNYLAAEGSPVEGSAPK